ncbi:site-specific DNA-methyltransferase [uncultured Roseobacter sp.]|uniref:DNA-methyltransferase n=1 Tax=uncultured Roseobacter sp. TaxID=114847 RepID=UPI00260F38C4|nr:site-specific DNA-methyltransferase [uncultured Roseobacter sp.]
MTDHSDHTVTILVGDALKTLRKMPDKSVSVVITSPPYWGLRDYGVEGQLGLEASVGRHVDAMIKVFREIHRVLKDDGICWVNYGDCYATTPNGRAAAEVKRGGHDDRVFRDKPFSTIGEDFKPKDLCMVPARFAIAMQADGWWIRSEIIWGKPNAMPDSAKDRPAVAFEKIYMFTKSARYFYNYEAVRQARSSDEDAPTFRGGCYVNGAQDNATMGYRQDRGNRKIPESWETGSGTHGSFKKARGPRQGRAVTPRHTPENTHTQLDDVPKCEGRNLRNYEPAAVQVWEMSTTPFTEAHFATFPPELVQRCIDASCRPGDVILDPFGGAGTTGLVAHKNRLSCIMIELNPEYAALARARLANGLVKLDRPAEPLPRIGDENNPQGDLWAEEEQA